MDWTYDIFMEDSKAFDAGEKIEEYRAGFIGWLKKAAKDFEAEWLAKHNGHRYETGYGYVGDAFAEEAFGDWFSDYYKEAYGQRPHLPNWFYIQAVKLPTKEDTFRTFCATPVEDAMEWAKETREAF